jgi:hypothetical protein
MGVSEYCTVFTFMKVRILKSKLVEVEKTKLGEVWDKQLNRWDELLIETVQPNGRVVNLVSYDGDVFLNVPKDHFEVLGV